MKMLLASHRHSHYHPKSICHAIQSEPLSFFVLDCLSKQSGPDRVQRIRTASTLSTTHLTDTELVVDYKKAIFYLNALLT